MSQADKQYEMIYTQNRELSWLQFNARVLEEAAQPDVPLLERLRFISIFTSNLDEFFMVRVGSLFDLSVMAPQIRDNKSGMTPKEQLEAIFKAVRPLIAKRDEIYSSTMELLNQKGIRDKSFASLDKPDMDFVSDYYKSKIKPLLSPQIIDRGHPFPHLKNKGLYAAALLEHKGKEMLGIVGVPDSIPPIIFLPGRKREYIRTEEILFSHLKKIFKLYQIKEASIISITRNADIIFDEDKFDESTPDFKSLMIKLLKQRERLEPVRMEMQQEAPLLRKKLMDYLRLSENQTYVCRTPLCLGYAYMLNDCDKELYYPTHTPAFPSYLSKDRKMWDQVQEKDVLLFYPYHSMQPFIELLKECADDPKVVSIHISIYRLAKNSAIVKNLCRAAENGKNVTVLIELRARFDEQNNIEWAAELEDAGCKILYGMDNYKCHSKICLITRQSKNGQLSYVTQVGTGNYNEKTAGIYTDFSLITADKSIAEDAVTFFQNMLLGNTGKEYSRLLVSPSGMKVNLMRLIDAEIARGELGHIILKVNSVTERELIDKLCEASKAGVRVELIVRGICCLLPGIKGYTENITVTGIVGQFLEHSRVYSFGDGDLRQMYISSADMMTRNQTRRVEIACPINDRAIKTWLSFYLETLLHDNVKARRLQSDGTYCRIEPKGEPVLSSQSYFMTNPPAFYAPVQKKSPLQNIFAKLKALGFSS